MKLPWRRAAVTTVLVAGLIGWAGTVPASAASSWDGAITEAEASPDVTTDASSWD